jgi:hypothetical protein
MSKHTPGPWEVGYLDKHGQRTVLSQHIEICTCWHHSVGAIEKEMEANARLIAAAPDLLDFARNIGSQDDWFERTADVNLLRSALRELRDAARAAIAKAGA